MVETTKLFSYISIAIFKNVNIKAIGRIKFEFLSVNTIPKAKNPSNVLAIGSSEPSKL